MLPTDPSSATSSQARVELISVLIADCTLKLQNRFKLKPNQGHLKCSIVAYDAAMLHSFTNFTSINDVPARKQIVLRIITNYYYRNYVVGCTEIIDFRRHPVPLRFSFHPDHTN